jgi:hypothetical protein
MKAAALAIGLYLIMGLSGASEYQFGTKVLPTDNDVGRPLFAMPAGTDVCFWDTGVVGYYDEEDVIYLATKPTKTVKANDIRLASLGDYPPGSKVRKEDFDIGMPLNTFAKGSAILYINLYMSVKYDWLDPVYFHQGTASYSVVNDVRLNYINDELMQGTKIKDFEPDLNKIFGTSPTKLVQLPLPMGDSRLGFFDVNGNGVYDYPDDVYMNFPQGVPKGSVAVNNIRLSAPV